MKKEGIRLNRIIKSGNTITYDFEHTSGLNAFFTGKPFTIEYPENIEEVPDGVAAVPFAANVLPLIWLCDATLELPCMDKDFYRCLPYIKEGYENMYPSCQWLGELSVREIAKHKKIRNEAAVGNDLSNSNRTNITSYHTAMFFSGGVDSVFTFIRHREEDPVLLSIWGSDIRYENREGWEAVYKTILAFSKTVHAKAAVIHSSFRDFDDEIAYNDAFYDKIGDNWWHGIKHGLALLGHVAPLAWLYGLEKMYIASTYTPEDGPVTCASSPTIDNHVRFCSCQVIHDGFEADRQKKLQAIVNYAEKNEPMELHVCWESQSGENCCRCEKCYRTEAGLIAENADPSVFGFYGFDSHLNGMKKTVSERMDKTLSVIWIRLRARMIENEKLIRQSPHWKDFRWITKADFEHPEKMRYQTSILDQNVRRLKKIRNIFK